MAAGDNAKKKAPKNAPRARRGAGETVQVTLEIPKETFEQLNHLYKAHKKFTPGLTRSRYGAGVFGKAIESRKDSLKKTISEIKNSF